ncbi:MAG: hypothetical protein ACRDIX_07225 [Actinomycetota bacterium]
MRYVYLGDRWTDKRYRGQACDPVRRSDGRCIVSGSRQLVQLADGRRVVVNRRMLRLKEKARRAGPGVERRGRRSTVPRGREER